MGYSNLRSRQRPPTSRWLNRLPNLRNVLELFESAVDLLQVGEHQFRDARERIVYDGLLVIQKPRICAGTRRGLNTCTLFRPQIPSPDDLRRDLLPPMSDETVRTTLTNLNDETTSVTIKLKRK